MIKKTAYTLLLWLAAFAAKAQLHDSTTVPIVGFEYVEQLMQQKNDTTYVINFWATWCGPCIRELPHFEALKAKYPNKKLKVILISLDFKKNYKNVLLPYLQKHKITSPVALLYEPDANRWIEKVSAEWSGSIPATLIFNKDKSGFYEKEFTKQELHKTVETYF